MCAHPLEYRPPAPENATGTALSSHRRATCPRAVDFNNDGKISPLEFVHGMKRAALKAPLHPLVRSTAGDLNTPTLTHHEYLARMSESFNCTLKDQCRMIFDTFQRTHADAEVALARVQAQIIENPMFFGTPL